MSVAQPTLIAFGSASVAAKTERGMPPATAALPLPNLAAGMHPHHVASPAPMYRPTMSTAYPAFYPAVIPGAYGGYPPYMPAGYVSAYNPAHMGPPIANAVEAAYTEGLHHMYSHMLAMNGAHSNPPNSGHPRGHNHGGVEVGKVYCPHPPPVTGYPPLLMPYNTPNPHPVPCAQCAAAADPDAATTLVASPRRSLLMHSPAQLRRGPPASLHASPIIHSPAASSRTPTPIGHMGLIPVSGNVAVSGAHTPSIPRLERPVAVDSASVDHPSQSSSPSSSHDQQEESRRHSQGMYLPLVLCGLCGKQYKRSRRAEHMEEFHARPPAADVASPSSPSESVASPVAEASESPIKSGNRVYCTYRHCNKSFSKLSNLNTHIRSYHEHRRYHCPVADCKADYSHPHSLRNHIEKFHQQDYHESLIKHGSLSRASADVDYRSSHRTRGSDPPASNRERRNTRRPRRAAASSSGDQDGPGRYSLSDPDEYAQDDRSGNQSSGDDGNEMAEDQQQHDDEEDEAVDRRRMHHLPTASSSLLPKRPPADDGSQADMGDHQNKKTRYTL